MTYLSHEQCRAARGLLGWTQQDLAHKTNLSKTAINNFEGGLSDIKMKTLSNIHNIFKQEGLFFLENGGIHRLKTPIPHDFSHQRGYTHHMITIEQCRAARGLLGWTQQKLADETGLSKTAINNFERGLAETKRVSLLLIRDAFEKGGAEFPTPHSVGKRIETVAILKGETANTDLWNDIFDTLKHDGGEVLISSVDEKRVLRDNPDGIDHHLKRLKDHNITERLLACEGDTTFLQPIDCYRWIQKDLFAALSPTFIYGDKVAIKLWEEKMVIVIQSTAAAMAERNRFNHLWDNALMPTL